MTMPEQHSVLGAREFLRSPEGEAPDAYIRDMIYGHLPDNWRKLIEQYGYDRVFDCLRAGLTVGGARYHLIRRLKPVPIEMAILPRRRA